LFDKKEIYLSSQNAMLQMVEEGISAVGGQLAVLVQGEVVVDIAVGQAEGNKALRPDDLHNVYCLFKPILYLLLGHLLETSGCSPDEPLNRILKMPHWAPECLTYRQLATHQAPLAEPSAAAWKLTPPNLQEDLLNQPRVETKPAYSQISGSLIAEHIIESITGLPPNLYCYQELLKPFGLTSQVIVHPELAISIRQRIRAPITGLPIEPLPMLSELLPSYLRETRLAVGTLATMGGMARLYEAVGSVLEGFPKPGFPSPAWLKNLMEDDRPFSDDPVFQRPAKWSAGMMTDVGRQNISRTAGPGSFGHTGGLANTVALYDSSRKATIALYLNGVGTEREDHILPRMQIVDTVINAFPKY